MRSIQRPNIPGIYVIWCIDQMRGLAGSSMNVVARVNGHVRQLAARQVANRLLARAMRLGLARNFGIVIFPVDPSVSTASLRRFEFELARALGTLSEDRGYNLDAGGVRSSGSRLRDREKKLTRANSAKFCRLPGVDAYDPIAPDLLDSIYGTEATLRLAELDIKDGEEADAAAYIKGLQSKTGLRNIDLAAAAGVSPNVVSMVLSGKMKVPIAWCTGLASALGVPAIELIKRVVAPSEWAAIVESLKAVALGPGPVNPQTS